MNVLIEFLGMEPIENTITCINFKMDKVYYFGYQEVIDFRKASTLDFLTDCCEIADISFVAVSHEKFQSVLKEIRKVIDKEICEGNELFFDITGGEPLMLVAFGTLAGEYISPMHMYNIEKNELIELFQDPSEKRISKCVPPNAVNLNLDRYIRMQGGTINYRLHKDVKDVDDYEFEKEIQLLWEVVKKHKGSWNMFSEFLRNHMVPNDDLSVKKSAREIIQALEDNKGKFNRPKQLNAILDSLAETGAILNLIHENGKFEFAFKSTIVKDLIWESGAILELLTYITERKHADDCMVGVHLDWDGVIHSKPGADVLNEIDVLSLKGNIPTFISCKGGKMEFRQTLHALYELETVAERFGGKYARKILVTTQPLSEICIARAKEMGIQIR